MYNFDRIRIEFYRDRQAAFEAFKKGDILYRAGIHLAHLGDRLRFPGDHRGQGRQARISRREAAVHAGDRRQPAARALPRRARAAGDRAVLRFRMDQAQSCSTAPTSARNPASSAPTTRPRGCPSPEELALLEPLRDKLPAEAFGEAVMQPASDGSGRDRKLLRRGVEAAGRGRLEARRAIFSSTTRARRLTVEILVDDESFVRVDCAVGREHEGDRHRRLDPAWSIRRSIRRGRPISIST